MHFKLKQSFALEIIFIASVFITAPLCLPHVILIIPNFIFQFLGIINIIPITASRIIDNGNENNISSYSSFKGVL